MDMNINGTAGNLYRESLAEISRMAYGHRLTEGKSGGNGNIGILVTQDGSTRVIKYNTHRAERNAAGMPTDKQIEMANNLRSQLINIARGYGVDDATMSLIRRTLGLPDVGEAMPQRLLDRKVVAKVVKMIDRDIWTYALKDKDMSRYSSANVSTTFTAVVGTVRDPGGRLIRDTMLLKTLTDVTNDELRRFGQYAADNNLSVGPKLSTTIHAAVVKAVRHRMTQAPNGADAERCRNLTRNTVVLSLLAWGREEEALRYINDHLPEAERKERLEETPFAASVTAMRAMRNAIRTMPASQQRAAIDLAVERLVTDPDGVITNCFGNTVGSFAVSVAVTAAVEAKQVFKGAHLDDTQRDFVGIYAAREKGMPAPQPVSVDEATRAEVKDVRKILGKGPKTVAFTPGHVTDLKRQLEEAVHTAIAHPETEDADINLITRDMQGMSQMIYGGTLSIHPTADAEPAQREAVRTDLKKVFTREDGTVDAQAMRGFVNFANQRLNAIVYVDHAQEHPDESEFPATVLPALNGSEKVEGTTIRLDRGCEPGTYRVTLNYVMKGRIGNVLASGNLIPLDPNDAENFVRYDCTFDFKVVDGRCTVSFPEIPTVTMNLKAPAVN